MNFHGFFILYAGSPQCYQESRAYRARFYGEKINMKKIELLAPAGSPESLDAAVGEGADAVYLGLKNFNARLRSANFAYSQFEGALKSLHRSGRKVYVTVNTVFEQREADRMYQLLKYLASLGPDALIVQDFGVVAMARQCFPTLKVHASTQMNIASARGANTLSKHGVSRVVLARELALEELVSIRANTNVELEVFVHGALCVSASGLCLFSSFLGGKSANRGMCTQACRRYYRESGQEGVGGGISGGYYFSPADLQLLSRLPELAGSGINAVKIEGRMKSAEYVGTVVRAYRLVIDALAEEAGSEDAIAKAEKILRGDFARSKTVFYFSNSSTGTSLDWLKPDESGGTGILLGNLLRTRGAFDAREGLLARDNTRHQQNHADTEETSLSTLAPTPDAPSISAPIVGDSIRLHSADDSDRRSYKVRSVKTEPEGVWISIPDGFDVGDTVYLTQTRELTRRYAPVIPHNLSAFRRAPGHEYAPEIRQLAPGKALAQRFPAGLYVAVSAVEDLYVVQSARPVRALLVCNRKTIARLLATNKQPIPFAAKELILVLDPYFPEELATELAESIPRLIEKGYCQFMLNNPGHVSLFRSDHDGAPLSLIAGPYLYVFNRFAASFVSALGLDYFVSPLENNRQNLEKTVDAARRALAFVPVFAYPALFRIRASLRDQYDFSAFADSHDAAFRLSYSDQGSLVIPDRPFSIVDKIPFLKEAGFGRFIIDFSDRKSVV
jgi:putative protease